VALTDTGVKALKHTGKTASGDKHSDGRGMYLLVKAAGKYWRMDYTYAGKRKTLALGVYPDLSLKAAREARDKARELLATDIDPGDAKKDAKRARIAAAANTFETFARRWLTITAHDRAEVTQTKISTWFEKDVFPFIGRSPLSALTGRDILDKVLNRVVARGAIDTAHRIKQVCGQVLRAAVVARLIGRDVTADLRESLPTPAQEHFPAITGPQQAGALMRSIFDYGGHPYTVAALKLSALVFVRPGELRGAEWAEIDLGAAEWRIPGSKMKMKVDHVVPLATQAVAILRSMHLLTGHGRYVFPSLRSGERPMSENTVNAALRGMGYSNTVHTAHGFRAMARTILDEVLAQRVDLIEHQLSHNVRDVNGRAYNRTTHLPARRVMMQTWADYLDSLRTGGEVLPFKRTA
jgi:integrase